MLCVPWLYSGSYGWQAHVKSVIPPDAAMKYYILHDTKSYHSRDRASCGLIAKWLLYQPAARAPHCARDKSEFYLQILKPACSQLETLCCIREWSKYLEVESHHFVTDYKHKHASLPFQTTSSGGEIYTSPFPNNFILGEKECESIFRSELWYQTFSIT